MAFKTNSYQQMTFQDSFYGLTTREQKALEKSWAKVFAEDLFPATDEEPFRALYSTAASRPNTPVNICIGALIIKEIFGISDRDQAADKNIRLVAAGLSGKPVNDVLADFVFNEEGTKFQGAVVDGIKKLLQRLLTPTSCRL